MLLVGGVGSLAYWTADGEADGGTITAGDLKLADGVCGADWVYADGAASAGDPVTLFVPGDQITKQCTFALEASGDNLEATVAAPTSVTYTAPGTTSLSLTADTTFAIDGPNARALANGATVNSEDDGSTITATFDVTIPFGTDESGTPIVNGNDTQNLTATLDTLTVTLTQDDPN